MSARVNECGHLELPHYAHGNCRACYMAARRVHRARRPPRVNECGHPQARHYALGMCKPCYSTVSTGGFTLIDHIRVENSRALLFTTFPCAVRTVDSEGRVGFLACASLEQVEMALALYPLCDPRVPKPTASTDVGAI